MFFLFFVIWMKVVWRKQQSNATGCFLFVRRAVGQWTDSRLAALRSHKEPAGTTQCFIRCRGLFKMEVFHWSLSLWSICSRVHTHTHTHRNLSVKLSHPLPPILLYVYAASLASFLSLVFVCHLIDKGQLEGMMTTMKRGRPADQYNTRPLAIIQLAPFVINGRALFRLQMRFCS